MRFHQQDNFLINNQNVKYKKVHIVLNFVCEYEVHCPFQWPNLLGTLAGIERDDGDRLNIC